MKYTLSCMQFQEFSRVQTEIGSLSPLISISAQQPLELAPTIRKSVSLIITFTQIRKEERPQQRFAANRLPPTLASHWP